MTFRFRVRRGIAALINAITPKAGELLFNLTDRTLRVGDGATPGGQKIRFAQDRYDLALTTTTTALDFALAQVWKIAHNGARTLTFQNQPASDRTMVAVIIINGSTGVITWPANVVWSGGVVPTLGATQTVITLLWTGNGWTGTVGSSY